MKTSFVLYTEYLKHMKLLTMEQRGVLFTAIMAYEGEAEMPEMDGIVEMAFSFIKVQLERDEERYAEISKKRSEARRASDKAKAVGQSSTSADKAEQTGSAPCKAEQSASGADNARQTMTGGNKAEKIVTNDDKAQQTRTNADKRLQTATNGCDNEDEDEDVDEDDRYIPPTLPQAHARKDELSSFLQTFGLVVMDVSPSDVCALDFNELSAAFAESDYLKNRTHEFSWVLRSYDDILRGKFRDKLPPKGKKSKMRSVYEDLKLKYEKEEEYAVVN